MTGIRFIEMGWRNFQSYGNNMTIISLDFKKPTVISGKNLDDSTEGRIDSNGAGKSTILNVLAFVLYDETISNIKKDKLINWINEKNMEGYVTFEKNGVFFKVERFRKHSKKGGDGIRIYSNNTGVFAEDDADIARSGIRQANEQIVEILGTPFDVFNRVVLLTASTDSFFSLPATSAAGKTCQRDILEELFGYTEISTKSEILKKKTAADKKELDRLFELNKQILEESERLQNQIIFSEEQSSKWISDNEAEITRLESIIKKQSEINFEEEKLIFDQIKKIEIKIQEKVLSIREKEMQINAFERAKQLFVDWDTKRNNDLTNIKASIQKYASIDFESQVELHKLITDYQREYDLLKREVTIHSANSRKLDAAIKSMLDEIGHLKDNKCPYCKQSLQDVQDKIDTLSANIELDKKQYTDIVQTETNTEDRIAALEKLLKEKRVELVFSTMNETLAKKVEAESLAKRLSEREAEANPHIVQEKSTDTTDISELKDAINLLRAKIDKFKCVQKFQNERDLANSESSLQSNRKLLDSIRLQTNPHTATISKLKNTQLPENKNKEIEELKDDVEHQEFLYKLLTKKDSYIRKALLSKNLPFLNTRLRHHLSKTGLPHKVMFTENMTAEISKIGIQIDYANLSKGQKCRIDLAVNFAFRDVLQTRHEKINLCMLDEFLDNGLSTAGVDMAVKMLKEIAREEKFPMFIISHKEEVAAMFDSKVEIELNKKFSNIVRADIPFRSTQ
jgi:DNA repair exonuclease SbcCD ATPase subunit